MGAKNKANLTAFVWTTYYRKASWTGSLIELASARGTIYETDVTNVVDVSSDTRWTAVKWVTPVSSISLTFLENASAEVLSDLLWETKVSNAGWATAVFPRTITLDIDDTYSFPELSNDALGVTGLVVKDSTETTTYVEDTDYSVTIVDDFTILTRLWGGAITVEQELHFTAGTVNINSNEEVTVNNSFTTIDEFEIVIKAKITNEAWETKFRTVTWTPATLNSTYQMEFIDFVKNGDINGASVKFDISEWGTIVYVNEHLSV